MSKYILDVADWRIIQDDRLYKATYLALSFFRMHIFMSYI